MPYLTNVAATQPFTIGDAAKAVRFDYDFLRDFTGPVILFDHVRMRSASFPPHPHAGLCIFSYVMEDSPGTLRDRDSINKEVLVEPGDLLWFQMANGLIHEENPAIDGELVHQMQVWINLGHDKQHLPPATTLLKSSDVPEFYDDDGNKVRVVLGEFAGMQSPLTPTEPFTLLDIYLAAKTDIAVPNGWSGILYVVAGEIEVFALDEKAVIQEGQVIGARENARVTLTAQGEAHALFMAKPMLDQPTIIQGMFAMSTQEDIDNAKRRFHRGEFGDVQPFAKLMHPEKTYIPAGQDPNVTVTVSVIHQATVRHYDEGWWQLHLQFCKFEYSDYETAYGYRFAWENPDGQEARYRLAGYIPYMEYISELLAIAARENWENLPYRDSF